MEEKIVITSGKKYIDIDAYASIFAYRELLRNLGYDAYAKTTAYLNESISSEITSMGFQFDEIEIGKEAKFIILDVSNPNFFDRFVIQNDIIEIIDHHTGYEVYWKDRNVKSQIEFIGSVCTIIFEKYVEARKEKLLTPALCKILIAGILDNTLNLKSSNTTKRDLDAYQKLLRIGNIDSEWSNIYFNSCYENLNMTLEESIKNDIKIEKTSSLLPEVLGQLIVLEKNVILNNIDRIRTAFQDYEEWVCNIISLEEGKSYLLFSSQFIKENLLKLFSVSIFDDYLVLDQCMLRKEIIKVAREYDGSIEEVQKIEKAREFCQKVKDLASEYRLSFFVVTEGASAISNNGCQAVKHARDCHIEWEKEHHFDPYEDWSKDNK